MKNRSIEHLKNVLEFELGFYIYILFIYVYICIHTQTHAVDPLKQLVLADMQEDTLYTFMHMLPYYYLF